jgi:hypothetical protein
MERQDRRLIDAHHAHHARHAPSRPASFRATSAILPTQPGSIASARAPDPGPSRRCLRDRRNGLIAIAARGVHSSRQRQAAATGGGDRRGPLYDAWAGASERVGLSGAEPRQYCRAVSAILHWSAEDSPTPSSRGGACGKRRASTAADSSGLVAEPQRSSRISPRSRIVAMMRIGL